jgi:parallel beta-helix repeat protein
MKVKVLISAILASMLAVTGCSDDSTATGSGGMGGIGGMGGTPVPKGCDDIPDASSYIIPNAPATPTDDCTMTLNPTGTNDNALIIDALVDNDLTNGTLCLGVGTWDMAGTIGITDDPGLTLKGIGTSPDQVVLDYADENGDCRGAKGINVGVDNVTIENLWIKNTCENGVEQRDTDGSVFRKVRVSWDDRCDGPRARANCGEACDCAGPFAPANCGEACDCAGPFAPANCGQACSLKICDDASDNAGDPCTMDGDCPNGVCVEDPDPCGDERLACESDACVPNDETYCDDSRLRCGSTDVCVPNEATYCDDRVLTCGDEATCVNNMTVNGAYGIYPTDCQNTLVEYSQVQGASDAGIYVGKCTGGSVKNNIVTENVAGLEVENCVGVDASNNEAFDNVGGLFALQQDIDETDMQSNTDVRLFDNESYCNNHPNFAKAGSAVSGIPVGTGILSFAGNGVEMFGNQITDNQTLGIGIASNLLNCQVAGDDCPPYNDGYDPYVKNNYMHDNVFTNNGTDPLSDFGTLFKILGFGTPAGPPVPNIVWDGYLKNPTDVGLCLGTDAAAAATVLVVGDACQDPINPSIAEYITCAQDNASTDQTPFLCTP